MTAIVAHFTNNAVPLVSPGTAPTIRIRRTDTGALVETDSTMTELGDGNFFFDFTTVDGLEYSIRADGDPAAAGQVTASERYMWGALSGTQEARLETDIPAILVDTGTSIPADIAALNDPTAAVVADAVWDEARAGHVTVGTFGEFTGAEVMRGTDGANTTVPMAAATSQTEHDATQADIAALNDPTAAVVADAVLDEALSAHVTAGSLGEGVARLFGGNTRTKLFFADSVISTVGRDVPANAVSHMEVSVRDEGGSFPGSVYYVVFNYAATDTSADSPKTSSVSATAPVDGSFSSEEYPS